MFWDKKIKLKPDELAALLRKHFVESPSNITRRWLGNIRARVCHDGAHGVTRPTSFGHKIAYY